MGVGCAIITLNEAETLARTLESVSFCDEIVVVDSGSTDDTIDIARRYTDKVYVKRWEGYGKQKNFAISRLSTDWVLSVDADEVVTSSLRDSIISAISRPAFDAYLINIQLVFLGKPLRFGGTYPDYHLRLFKKEVCRFDESGVHERAVCHCKTGKLKGVMLHYSYRDLSDYLEKFNKYTTLIAKKHHEAEKRVSKLFPFLRISFELFKRIVLKGAFLDGYEGMLYATLSSFYTFVKYAKLIEMQER